MTSRARRFGPRALVHSPSAAVAPRFGAGGLIGVALALLVAAPTVLAGPVLVYREGPGDCPRDRPANAPRITAEQAIERAKTLIPRDFCGPNWWVSGCWYDPEWAYDTWRVFAQQYKLVDGVKDDRGRDHTYIVLDAVGNCISNIPGT